MSGETYVTLYLCNGNDPKCVRCGVCAREGYDLCCHTSNSEATSSEPCDEPWKYPERFKSLMDPVSGEVFFFERFLPDKPFRTYEGGKWV